MKGWYRPLPAALHLLFFMHASPIAGWAANYYVSPTGRDSNPGTSYEAPFQTIQKAHDISRPGDSVWILDGDFKERIRITRSGAPGQPIIYQASGNAKCEGFTIQASYIQVIGFEIMDTSNDGLDSSGVTVVMGKYNEIRSNYIHDVTQIGISVGRAI